MLDKSKINVGDTHSEVVVEDLKRTQIVQYAGASGDYNPLPVSYTHLTLPTSDLV